MYRGCDADRKGLACGYTLEATQLGNVLLIIFFFQDSLAKVEKYMEARVEVIELNKLKV